MTSPMVLGVNVVRYRLYAIMISAFLTAMAGTFYAQYILYIDPESVMILPISVQIVLVAMLGGANTVLGPVVGSAILIPLSEYSQGLAGLQGHRGGHDCLWHPDHHHLHVLAQRGVGLHNQLGEGEANERFAAIGCAGRQQILRRVAGQ